ncbi:Uncharacterised protein [Leclercia adecarboxylata]|uniref:Uncharacterized protein n=1 Tax=Leclercia adecarboxylata TaxID=83655 RepID=A0A4U9HY92_9ENTR|nr:Uncharacterised protein [Leclercia adecarboxylata]
MKELPKDYFLGVDDELVDYLEKQGEETIREIHLSNKINVENGYKLLNIQIVGIGSSFLLLTQKANFDFSSCGNYHIYFAMDMVRYLPCMYRLIGEG